MRPPACPPSRSSGPLDNTRYATAAPAPARSRVRDAWAPPVLPASLPGLLEAAGRVLPTLDADDLQHYGYAAARYAFFTASGLGANLLQRTEYSVRGLGDVQAGISQEERNALILRLLGNQTEMIRRDRENIKRGYYKVPFDRDLRHRQFDPAFVLDRTVRYQQGLDATQTLRQAEEGGLAMRESTQEGEDFDAYPEYYLQNFHFQKDGWMSTTSAKTYEHATEVLFQGIQDVMQRQALVPVAQHFSARGRPPAAPGAPPPVFMDVACGTGRFLTFVKDNYPDFQTIGVDLSPYYLSEARQNMEYFNEYNAAVNPRRALAKSVFRQAAAEALPNADASVDVLTCVYLFHELPPEVRRECAKEFFRVLKPGGCLVLNDSLQGGDNPELDAILPLFPGGFHEPYYLHYAQDDIVGLFEEAGFITTDVANAFLSKVFAFRKPDVGEEPAAAEPGALAPEGGEGGLEKSR